MVQCYDWDPNTSKVGLLSDAWQPCPAGDTCCLGTHLCLGYNLCSSKSTYKRDNAFSGYYVARCTDPTYTDPACQKVCSAPGPPDAVYNSTSQQWNCCGKNAAGDVSCDDPTTEIFQAPAPSALVVIQSGSPPASSATLVPGSKTTSSSTSISSSSTSSSTVVSSLTSSSTATSSTSTSQTTPSSLSTDTTPDQNQGSSSNGLSSGAKAGIGIGVALGVAALVAVIVFLLLRKKRQNQAAELPLECPGYTEYSDDPAGTGVVEKPARPEKLHAELPDNAYSRRGVQLPVHEIGSSR